MLKVYVHRMRILVNYDGFWWVGEADYPSQWVSNEFMPCSNLLSVQIDISCRIDKILSNVDLFLSQSCNPSGKLENFFLINSFSILIADDCTWQVNNMRWLQLHLQRCSTIPYDGSLRKLGIQQFHGFLSSSFFATIRFSVEITFCKFLPFI